MKVHYNGEDQAADLSTLYKKLQESDLTTLAVFTNARSEIIRNRFVMTYVGQKSAKALKFYVSYR